MTVQRPKSRFARLFITYVAPALLMQALLPAFHARTETCRCCALSLGDRGVELWDPFFCDACRFRDFVHLTTPEPPVAVTQPEPRREAGSGSPVAAPLRAHDITMRAHSPPDATALLSW